MYPLTEILSIRKLILILLFLGSGAGSLFAQTEKDKALAYQYFRNGDFDKATEYFERVFQKEPGDDVYYNLFACYSRTKSYDALEKLVIRQLRRSRSELKYQVDLGEVYKLEGKTEKTKSQFESILKDLPPDESVIRQLAGSFSSYGEVEYALKTYQKGAKLLHDAAIFSFDIASLYFKQNNIREGISSVLDFIAEQPGLIQMVFNFLQTEQNKPEAYDELETQLYLRIQKQPANEVYNDALLWLLVQKKDFASAFIQVKSIDKRRNDGGERVMQFGRQALTEEFYDEAIKAFEYLCAKGNSSPNYLNARIELLNARKQKVSKGLNYTQEDLGSLKNDYLSFLKMFGYSPASAQTIIDLAQLEGLYMAELDSAIILLQQIVSMPGIPRTLKNKAKLDLGDYTLMNGDFWESTLIYSQVDKDEKDGVLGEDARYRNARLSYYKGEFEWAQAQLDVLKGATSELIANDALNLSVFIMDNLGLDTITTPLEMFAAADLLIFQHKYNEAGKVLDSIEFLFPNHALTDDIWMARAKMSLQKQDFTTAADFLKKIIAQYKTDILGDDATFMLATIYEKNLNEKEKAMGLYKDVMMNFKDSVYLTEARKRYRALRGDKKDVEN